jgi:hypothetical protein
MTWPRSSLGLFGMFGRSADLRQLDAALRAVDMHPRLVPEAVKLTAVSLIKQDCGRGEPAAEAYHAAAEMIAFGMVGVEAFAGVNDEALVTAVEERVEVALEAGDSLDAQLLLLMLHAGVLQPSVQERYGLESDGG